jgi:hypothetical protein
VVSFFVILRAQWCKKQPVAVIGGRL